MFHDSPTAFPSNLTAFNCRDLLLEFHSFLSGVKREKAVVLLIDGVDLLQDGRGQLNSDWIPQQLPQVSYTHRKMPETESRFFIFSLSLTRFIVIVPNCSVKVHSN